MFKRIKFEFGTVVMRTGVKLMSSIISKHNKWPQYEELTLLEKIGMYLFDSGLDITETKEEFITRLQQLQ